MKFPLKKELTNGEIGSKIDETQNAILFDF